MKRVLKQIVVSLLCVSFFLIISSCDSGNNSGDNSGNKTPKNDLLTDFSVELPAEPLAKDIFEKASVAVTNMKSGVNLFNSLDSHSFSEEQFLKGEDGWIVLYGDITKPSEWEKAWNQPIITQKFIKAIKAAGFNAVRVPVTWAEHIDFSTGEINEAWMNRVKEVVDWIIDEEMYCLLNTHHDGGETGWVEASDRAYNLYKSVYAKMYVNIANKFKDYSEKLILCGTNEMISADNNWGTNVSTEAYNVVNKWNQLFVNCVRSTGGKNACRNLMVGTYVCSTEGEALNAFAKPNDNYDKHLIMEVHIYSPKGFVWEPASWIKDWSTTWNSEWEGDVKSEFDRVKTCADKHDMPVIIGEWGTLARRNPSVDDTTKLPKWDATTDEEGAKFTSFFIKESRQRGFTGFYWDTSEIMSRETGNVTSPLMLQGICENY